MIRGVTEIGPKDRVLSHIENVRDWLRRAEDGYKGGATFQGELNLNLARAELKKAWEESRVLHEGAQVIDFPEVRAEAPATHRKRRNYTVLTRHRAGLVAAVVLLFFASLTPAIFQGAVTPKQVFSGKHPDGVRQVQTEGKNVLTTAKTDQSAGLTPREPVESSRVETMHAETAGPHGAKLASRETPVAESMAVRPSVARTAMHKLAAVAVKVVASSNSGKVADQQQAPFGLNESKDRLVSNSPEEVTVRSEDTQSSVTNHGTQPAVRETPSAAPTQNGDQYPATNRTAEVKAVATSDVQSVSYDVDSLVHLAQDALYRH